MRYARLAVVGAAVGVAALLAGCGGSGSDDPAGGAPTGGAPASVEPAADSGAGEPPDPCTLLTEAEVSEAAGAEVTGVDGPIGEHQGTSCRWSYPADLLGEVTVSVWVGHDFYSPDAISEGWAEVPGIGDEAHRATSGPLCTLIFKHGEYVVQVLSSEAGDDGCLGLAEFAAARI